MFWIKLVKKLITLLHSNISPSEIAGGVALGAIIGLSPFSALHSFCIVILIILLNVNVSSATFSILIFSLLGFLIDPLSNLIGRFLLIDMKSLNSMWTALYNMPIVPFTRFYNTVVLGSFVISIILVTPIYIGTKIFIRYYRANVAKKVEQWKIVKMFKMSSIFSVFDKYRA